MEYRRLFILVEGNDDERFVNKIFKPLYEQNNFQVIIWKYAEETKKRINKLLKSIRSMNANYIYLSDIDGPCVTVRKEKIKNLYNEFIENDRIGIVVKEIESWYLGGLNDTDTREFTGHTFRSTDTIIKEQFNTFVTHKYDSRTDFMIEMLKHFSIDVAKVKNKSFKYFCDKFLSAVSGC